MDIHRNASKKESAYSGFVDWLVNQNKSENTIKTYTGVLSQFVDWIGLDFLDEANEENVQAYLDYLEDSQKSPGTIEKHFMTLSVYFKFLGKPHIMMHIDRKVNNNKNKHPESLSTEEQVVLLKEVITEGNLRNTAMVYILLHTGLRVSELCELNECDLHLDDIRTFIEIRKTKGEIERVVPLSNEAAMHLKSYLSSEKERGEPLFLSSYGQRITPRAVQYILKKFNVHPHKLRHTFCQQLIDKGIDLQIVSKLAGHKDLNMTKRYLREKELNLEQAIDQAFSKP